MTPLGLLKKYRLVKIQKGLLVFSTKCLIHVFSGTFLKNGIIESPSVCMRESLKVLSLKYHPILPLTSNGIIEVSAEL